MMHIHLGCSSQDDVCVHIMSHNPMRITTFFSLFFYSGSPASAWRSIYTRPRHIRAHVLSSAHKTICSAIWDFPFALLSPLSFSLYFIKLLQILLEATVEKAALATESLKEKRVK